MELILVRHAEPVRIVDADGPADPPLAERGIKQAEALASYLGAEPIGAVWSSPMQRARETAAPLAAALGCEVVVDTELAEWDRASTSYIPIEELKANKDERWVAMVEGNLEGDGIDLVAFRDGVVSAMDHIVTGNPGASVAVVCHGGVINTYLADILGIDRPLWFEPKYTSIHRVLASRRGDRSLETLNEIAHLRGTNLLG
ncbi:MAG TPA: histidine phosphatase family protein [Acidimicrobiales bacterium]|nr:histidine phosphatase family protein [Acidimicrobiales bacterium]